MPVASQPIYTSLPASTNTDDGLFRFEITEQFLRDFIKSEVPRLIRRRSRALLVEEMDVCLGRARVDLAVIADKLIGIEIKGPKDDVTRLPRQVSAYSKCFDRVVLVIHRSLVDKARPLIPTWWGLVVGMEIDGAFVYEFERRPRLNPDRDIDAVLALLWREEIDALMEEFLGSTPKSRANKRDIREALRASVDVNKLHDASLNKLRDRTDWRTVPVHRERLTA